ncbi:MAG: SprB repeat-containing protein, partial [Flavobacteriales bacterium]|nr:SprB repeat-containing protein [Flavobacteriales bacterium]
TGGITTEDLFNIPGGNYSVTVTDDEGCTATANTSLTDPAPITITIVVVDASCGLANGSACATPIGGTAPFTYSWNDTLFQTTACALTVPAGSYTVNLIDANGCSASANANVNDLPGASATALVTSNASAFGVCDGVASVSMPGSAPFTYLWDDLSAQTTAIATGLCGGMYCAIVIDAAGCSDTACITITEPNAMTMTLAGTNNNCFGDCNGTATITVVGGTAPHTFQWTGPNSFASASQNLIGLCAGTYDVTLTDANAATIIDQIIITEPTTVTATVASVNASCNGACDGTVTVSPSGGTPPHTYVWDDGFSQTTATAVVLCTGTYNVTVTDALGCQGIASGFVNEPLAIVVTITPSSSTCGASDGSVQATSINGSAPYTYVWSTACVTSACPGLPSGLYSVTITDGFGCTGIGAGSIVDAGGPTLAMTDSVDVNCFGGNDGSATAAVSDGTPPYAYSWNSVPVQTTLIATGLTAGAYSILVTDANGCQAAIGVTLSEPPQLIAGASGTGPTCNAGTDGSVTASVSGGIGPYTYSWTGGCSTASCGSLSDGTYSLTVTDANGCIANASTSIASPPVLAMLLTGNDVSCGGLCDGTAVVVPSGGVSPYTYSWSNGDITQTTDSLCASTVILSLTDANQCLAASSVVISEPQPIVASITSYTDIDCNGNCNGFAQSTTTGGVGPYAYVWNNSAITDQITGLCVGTYILTVTDFNGCVGNTSVNISEPPPMTLSLSSTNVTCNAACDGTATVTPAGGLAPYFYLWNDGALQTTMNASSLCAGVYLVVVTDSKGCTNNTTVTLTEPQPIGLITSTVSSTCGDQNGEASVVVTGGVLPYTMQWNDPNFTVASSIDSVYAGVYTLIFTDGNGCIETKPVIINDITGPTIDSVTTLDIPCFGMASGSAQVYATGGTPQYTYYWQDNAGDTIGLNINIIFSLGGGTYTIAVRDANDCLSAVPFSLNEPQQIVSAFLGSTDETCFQACDGTADLIVVNGTPPYTYSWPPTANITANAVGLCSGFTNVVITDTNGCTTNDQVLINPASELIPSITGTNVSCLGLGDGEITVSVTGGSTPYSYQWLPGGIGNGVTVSNLGPGSYLAIITDVNGCDTTQTMVITEPAAMVPGTGSSPATCGQPNGTASISVTGGTSPYTFTWFDDMGIPIGQVGDTATALLAGNYECQIEDANGCTMTFPAYVSPKAGPVVSLESVLQVPCEGTNTGEATVSVTGFGAFNYT